MLEFIKGQEVAPVPHKAVPVPKEKHEDVIDSKKINSSPVIKAKEDLKINHIRQELAPHKYVEVPKIPWRLRWLDWKVRHSVNGQLFWSYKLKKNLHRKDVRRFGRSTRRIAYGSLIFVMSFYLAYLMLVYNFPPKNLLFEQISSQLPAPAIVSNYGLVDFYDYQQIKTSAENFGNQEDSSFLVLKWQIVNSLAEKYDVDQGLDQDLLVEVLKRKIIRDSSMNYYGSRMYLAIKQAQRQGDGLQKISEKTGLTIHRASYAKKIAAKHFGDLIYGLRLNAISPVIINDKGVYVLSILANNATSVDFDYLFVPARTLEQMIDEKLAESWVVSLVD